MCAHLDAPVCACAKACTTHRARGGAYRERGMGDWLSTSFSSHSQFVPRVPVVERVPLVKLPGDSLVLTPSIHSFL